MTPRWNLDALQARLDEIIADRRNRREAVKMHALREIALKDAALLDRLRAEAIAEDAKSYAADA